MEGNAWVLLLRRCQSDEERGAAGRAGCPHFTILLRKKDRSSCIARDLLSWSSEIFLGRKVTAAAAAVLFVCIPSNFALAVVGSLLTLSLSPSSGRPYERPPLMHQHKRLRPEYEISSLDGLELSECVSLSANTMDRAALRQGQFVIVNETAVVKSDFKVQRQRAPVLLLGHKLNLVERHTGFC